MPRLYRPHVPVEVRCRVALRQLGELWPDDVLAQTRGGHAALLAMLLAKLSSLLGDAELRLDHDPALATRQQFKNGRGEVVRYVPAANDPEYLVYRTAHAHHIKTQVRGDGAQHPDRVLIKRARRAAKPDPMDAWVKAKRRAAKRKWPSRPFPKGRKFDARHR